MPYQAAKQLAATFCWDVRWALTPVFGNDFPQICRPHQNPSFARFVIDPQIVRFCNAETARFREEGASYQLPLPSIPSPVMTPSRPILSSLQRKHSDCSGDSESGYGSDLDRKDAATFSPHISPMCQPGSFTAINGAESPNSPCTTLLTPGSSSRSPGIRRAPTSVPNKLDSASLQTKRSHSKVAYSDNDCGSEKVDSPQMQLVQPASVLAQDEQEMDTGAIEAAEALMSLGVVGRNAAAMPSPKRTRRGSRY